MKLLSHISAAATLAGFATAYPHIADRVALEERQDPHAFQFNPVGSVRAPCPGLNTMANHGYINRNGFGISKQQMQQGFLDAFGMAFDATSAGGDNAIAQCGRLTGRTCTTFNLDQLDLPHAIEHDASLSRRDRQMAHDQNANNVAFNQTIWNRSLAIYGATSHIGIKFANTARIKRVQQAQGADFPGWFIENVGGSLAEHSFILSTMNDPAVASIAAPQARMDWLNFWITKMQLPTPLGWHKPTSPVTHAQIASLAAAIQNAPTVTAAVGTSPFLARRGLEAPIAQPQPSYNLELNPRAAPALANVPVASIPNYDAPEIAHAKARARMIVGAPPALPNPYTEVLSAGQWDALAATVGNYTAKFQGAVASTLGMGAPPAV